MTHSSVILRPARPKEAESIAVLSRDLIEYGLQWRWTPMRVALSIRAANVNVVVALSGSRIAGFGIMRYGDDSAHLDLLAVVPDCRKAGVGRQLMAWLEKCAAVGGIFSIALEVRAANRSAILFYERLGFRTVERVPGYYQGIEPALRMEKSLSSPTNRRLASIDPAALHPALRLPRARLPRR